MDKSEIVRALNRLAMNLEGVKDSKFNSAVTGNYLSGYIQEARRLAREVEQLPEPGRMRDVVKRGMRW